ncbi:MAG: PAS domain S-box protein [Gammaproteobacteria bacterium]|nr:PAS domain S-box protein [Gammaproteobacteria bacterium]
MQATLEQHIAADAVTFSTDVDGRVRHWSPAAEALYGIDGDSAHGALIDELIAPVESRMDFQLGRKQAVSQGIAEWEHLRSTPQGKRFIGVSCRVQRLPEHLLLFHETDRTQRAALMDSRLLEQRFLDLMELLPDGMLICNEAGTIVLANSQLASLTGYRRRAMVGMSVDLLIPSAARANHSGHRDSYFEQPVVRPMRGEPYLHVLHKNGSEIPVGVSLSPIPVGNRLLAMAAVRDYTHRYAIEEEIRRSHAALQEANRTKDRFLTTITHELRTPLNAIIGYVGTMQMGLPGPLNAAQTEQLAIVNDSANHLLSLINDLLDVAKIDGGKVTLKPVDVNCGVLLERTRAQISPLADKKKLALNLVLPDEPMVIHTDERALFQIILNLASNAAKYTEAGQVTLALEKPAGGGDGIVFRVSDTGCGIASDLRNRLYQEFASANTAFDELAQGHGLGLYLCRRLATMLGAELKLADTGPDGTTFTLTFNPEG